MSSKPYIGIVGCGKVKLATPAKARDLYIGDLYLLNRDYIETVTDDWYILSAKYGLVHHDEVISPYDTLLRNYNARQREAWVAHVRHQVRATFPTNTLFVTTSSKDYRKALPANRTICPWDDKHDMRWGKQRQWLMQQIKNPTWRADQLGCAKTTGG